MPMPPLESLNCSRGAPMGRSNRCEMGADSAAPAAQATDEGEV